MDSSSNSSSLALVTLPKKREHYEVFVSFRREDTRNNITSFLFSALEEKGISVFRNDSNLFKGESIGPELFQAIEDSQIFVVIFSKNYASSTRCLQELEKIRECVKVSGKHVLPVFYDVVPYVVRDQSGIYGEAFVKHEITFEKDYKKVQQWRKALTIVGSKSGWDLRDVPQSAYIKAIVQKIIDILGHNLSCVSKEGMANLQETILNLAASKNVAAKSKDLRNQGAHVVGHPGVQSPGSGSQTGGNQTHPPPASGLKKCRVEEPIIVDDDQHLLPSCVTEGEKFAKWGVLTVSDADKEAIQNQSAGELQRQISRDIVGLIRMIETTMVLSETEGCSISDFKKAKEDVARLKGRLNQVETDYAAYRDKHVIQADLITQLNKKEGRLKVAMEELKKMECKVGELERRVAISPDEEDRADLQKLGTRADLVFRILQLEDGLLNAVCVGFKNALEQVKVVNPGLKINVEGIGHLHRVVDGQVVPPPGSTDNAQD